MTVAELNTPSKLGNGRVRSSAIFLWQPTFRILPGERSAMRWCWRRRIARELSVIHVLQPDRKYGALENPPEIDPERVAAETQIKALVDELGPEHKIDATLVKHGPVVAQVTAAIEQNAIDLLVIGTRGRGGLQKLALGSVAEELLRVAPCPVMTIGPKADIATVANGPGFHRILFATDFGKGSAKALPSCAGTR